MLLKKYISFAYNIVLTFLLFGCMSSNQFSKFQNLVFPDNCKNACWIGIEPKISTTDETTEILENFYGAENITSDNSGNGSWLISWNVNKTDWQNRGTVFISKDIVDFVLVWFPENSMTVKDIVAKIGDPDSVGLVISGPIVKCAGASLLYPHTGLQVYISPVNKSVGVDEAQVVNGFDIHPPWISDNSPWTDTEIIPWDGYHEYCPEKWSWEK